MKIEKVKNNGILTIAVSGRLDTLTAPEFGKEISEETLADVNELIIDFKDLEYTSSSGLVVLLKAQKIMNSKGKMQVINVNENIMEIFEITGFTDIITIK